MSVPPKIASLISRQIDGGPGSGLDSGLDEAELNQLQDWINANRENAQQFAFLSLLHNRLRNELSVSGNQTTVTAKPIVNRTALNRAWESRIVRYGLGALATATIVFVGFLLLQGLQGVPAIAAEQQLERLIEVSRNSTDRTYLITAIEKQRKRRPRQRGGVDMIRERKGRPQPPVDGAILHLRDRNQYVLIRKFKNGDEFITGSDGKTSWSVPPEGRVRVSDDLKRFEGSLPGNQHAIPFINVHEDLESLRGAYTVRWLEPFDSFEAGESQCLVAEKKSADYRGPKNVEIRFDPATGLITELLLDKLPKAKGGPGSVLLELIDETSRPDDFYRHTSHHDADRELVKEEK